MSQPHNSISEIAHLREQIAREHEAACWASAGLTVGTAKHWFITRRMEHIGAHQQRLSDLIGEQQSMAVVVQVMETSPAQHRQQPARANPCSESTSLGKDS